MTGGNGGLGQRICHAQAKEGAHITVMYAQSHEEAEVVARELTSRHQIDAAAFACDITDGAAVERVVGQVTGRFGRLDILVNDAAYDKSVPFPDLDGLTSATSSGQTTSKRSKTARISSSSWNPSRLACRAK